MYFYSISAKQASRLTSEQAMDLQEDSRYEDRSEFKLNFLWMDKNIGVAVDQVFAKVQPMSTKIQEMSDACYSVPLSQSVFAAFQHCPRTAHVPKIASKSSSCIVSSPVLCVGHEIARDRILLLATQRCLGRTEDWH